MFGDLSLPGMPSVVDVTIRNGIQVIADEQKPVVIGALQILSPNQTSSAGADPIIGDLYYVAFSVGSTWLNDLVKQGLVVLVSYPITSTPKMIGTKLPAVISQYATAAGGYAIVDGPADLISAATGTAAPVTPKPTVDPATICPSGYILASDGRCEPGPGVLGEKVPAQTTAVIQQQPTSTPGWVWPVLIGGAAVVLVAAVVANKPKRSGIYAMNVKHTKAQRAKRWRRAVSLAHRRIRERRLRTLHRKDRVK